MRDAYSYACPASDRRQFFGGATHHLKRSSRSRFGRRHDRALHNRRVTNHDAGTARFRQHFNRHLAVGFGATEIDQDRDAAFRPRPLNRGHNRFDAGTQAAARISAAPAERHFMANHLLDHQGSAPRHVRRMRYNDDSDIFAHARPSITSATASTINAEDRAPGSM